MLSLWNNGVTRFFDSEGRPLSGGLLYTYMTGTTTPLATYTDLTGDTAHPNPIKLDSTGSATIWINGTYSMLLADSGNVAQAGYPVDGVSSLSSDSSYSEWVAQPGPFSYVGATSFSVAGDQRTTYRPNRRVKATVAAGDVYGKISASAYTTVTTVTVVWDSGALDAGLSAVAVGLLSPVNDSVPRETVTSAAPAIGKATECDANGQLPVTSGTVAGVAASVGQVQANSTVYAAASGGTDTYTFAMTPAPDALTEGMRVCFKADAANTGPATVKVGALVAVALKKYNGAELVTGDILASQIVEAVHNGTYLQVVSRLGSNPVVILSDQKSQNTASGTFTSGAFQVRVLNTEVDPAGICTLAANLFTLDAGTYKVRVAAPAYAVGLHQAVLYNSTDAAAISVGTCAYADNANVGLSLSIIEDVFTIEAGKALEILHRGTTTVTTNGFGRPCNFGTEKYTVVSLEKIA